MNMLNDVASIAIAVEERTIDHDASFERLRSKGVGQAALEAVRHLSEAGLRPSDDRATQIRLSNALLRAETAPPPVDGDRSAATASVMRDVMLQEAAAARLAAAGKHDPLAAVTDPASARGSLNAASMLKRSGVGAHPILDRATDHDAAAIAGGRFDRIEGEHTRFAVSSQLRLDSRAMAVQTIAPANRAVPVLGKGPTRSVPMPVVERGSAGR